jgi:hypothetical protein
MSLHLRALFTPAVLALTLAAAAPLGTPLVAQSAVPASDAGVYLTIFRNPSTGLEWRGSRYGVNGGFYPTILKADGQSEGENTNFIRLGATAYLRRAGWTPYLSPSLLISLDDDWDNGVLTDVGVRLPFTRRAAFRLGVGVLTTFDGEVRVNPTVGFDVRLGGAK